MKGICCMVVLVFAVRAPAVLGQDNPMAAITVRGIAAKEEAVAVALGLDPKILQGAILSAAHGDTSKAIQIIKEGNTKGELQWDAWTSLLAVRILYEQLNGESFGIIKRNQ